MFYKPYDAADALPPLPNDQRADPNGTAIPVSLERVGAAFSREERRDTVTRDDAFRLVCEALEIIPNGLAPSAAREIKAYNRQAVRLNMVIRTKLADLIHPDEALDVAIEKVATRLRDQNHRLRGLQSRADADSERVRRLEEENRTLRQRMENALRAASGWSTEERDTLRRIERSGGIVDDLEGVAVARPADVSK